MSLTPEELRRLVRRDLWIAGGGSLVAIWTTSLILAAHMGFISHLTADRVVAAVSIVVCLGSIFWWAAGPGIYAIHDLGATLVAVALSSAVGFFGAAVLGMALSRRHA